MAMVAGPPAAAERWVTLPRVDWATYERLLADDPDRRLPRLTYDQGVVEIVSPSTGHEEDAQTLNLLVEIVAAILDVPIRNVGSMTYRREDAQRGFEPDASFYIQREPQVRGRLPIDPAVDPPPDLVIEVEVSRSAVDKLAIFARLGVPEVWRSDRNAVAIFPLAGDTYREVGISEALPPLTGVVLTRFLAESRSLTRPAWFRAVSDWAGAQRPPRGMEE